MLLGCRDANEVRSSDAKPTAPPGAPPSAHEPSSLEPAPDGPASAAATAAPDGDDLKELERKRAELAKLEEELANAKDDARRKELEAKLEDAKKAQAAAPKAPSTGQGARCAPGDPLCVPDDREPGGGGKKTKALMLASTKSLTDRVSNEELEGVISSNIQRFVPCTKVEIAVTLHAMIAPEGRVLEASATGDDASDPKTRECVASAFKTLVFPKSSAARPTPVTFDLSLKPQDG
jgi:hypothetical protein